MLKIGIVGAAGMRAGAFRVGIESTGKAVISAVCDVSKEKVEALAAEWGIEAYTDYIAMLEQAGLDAVILSTPVTVHTAQALEALKRNIHVYSEIPAAASLAECKELVAAAKASKATYVLGENMVYMREYMTVENMVNAGLFGDIYYMQGEYLHDIKEFFEISPWRKEVLAGVNGITYGTHSLGPMLIWMQGDRISKLMCTGTGHHYTDPVTGGPYAQEDGCLMVCKTEQGRSVDIRVEMMSTRPYGLNYRMQGTKGHYENVHNWDDGFSRVWYEAAHKEGASRDVWMEFDSLAEEYVPEIWREVPKEIMETTTHWGIDYVTMREWVAHLCGERPFRVDIHKAMDLTLPGLISTMSIENDSQWMEVPNSRDW